MRYSALRHYCYSSEYSALSDFWSLFVLLGFISVLNVWDVSAVTDSNEKQQLTLMGKMCKGDQNLQVEHSQPRLGVGD